MQETFGKADRFYPVTYEKVKPEMVIKILKDHVIGGKIFKKAAAKDDYYENIKKQQRVALEFGGKIDPESIDEYIEVGGYSGLKKALQMKSFLRSGRDRNPLNLT